MTTLLIAFVLYFFFCGFIYQPKQAPLTASTEVASTIEPEEESTHLPEPAIVQSFPDCWLLVESGYVEFVDASKTLTNYTIRELKKIASANKIKNYSNMTKATLIENLKAIGCI